jgi:hypothetical protein
MEEGAAQIVVQPQDVLYGKKKESYNHGKSLLQGRIDIFSEPSFLPLYTDGNVVFRDVITKFVEMFANCQSIDQKSWVIHAVIDKIEERGGRFIRKHQVHGYVSEDFCFDD